jgi:hypothetical protein
VFSDTSVGIGSFGTAGNTFTNFVLQPGIYQVHLSIDEVSGSGNAISMWLNNNTRVGSWYVPPTTFYVTAVNISGDRLLAAASANTSLSFQVNDSLNIGAANCTLIITQLQ